MAGFGRSLGLVGGAVLAPLTGLVSYLRKSRMFHPAGLLYRAEVSLVATDPGVRELGERLSGQALVRFSSAWWKAREWPDVLGCAIRFTEQPLSEAPVPHDQDLLFATIRRPWTLPFAPLTTRFHDYLANHYYAVSPFVVADMGRVEWRLRPQSNPRIFGSRGERLQLAVSASRAELTLELAPYRPPWKAFDDSIFRPLVRLRLVEALELDQAKLRYDPFRAGRGVVPVGLIHALRLWTYAASQRARPQQSSVLSMRKDVKAPALSQSKRRSSPFSSESAAKQTR